MRTAFLALLLAISAQAQPRSKAHLGLVIGSIMALQVATAVDVASTVSVVGTRLPDGRVIGEANPLLAGRNHSFGAKGIGVSFGISSGMTAAEWWLLRRNRRYDSAIVVSNFGATAAHLFAARQNWRLGR